MKFKVSSQSLLKKLQLLSGVIGTNSVLPILEDFKIELEGNRLEITTSDLETSMSDGLEVEGFEDGTICIPSKILLETLKALPEQSIDIEINNDTFAVCIITNNGKYNLIGESGEDFPNIARPEETSEIVIPAKVLEGAIKKTLFAVSNDDLRPAMTGVNFVLSENGAIFVSTDAHKLVKYKADVKGGDTSFIVPKKALGLVKAAIKSEDPVHLAYNETNAFFTIGETEIICRLVDGRYPDYDAVIPVNNPHTLIANRKDLMSALNRIAIYSPNSTSQAVLRLQKGMLHITAEDKDYSNEAAESLPASYDGEEMEIAFNAKFLSEVLSIIETDEVHIKLSTPSRAGIVMPSDKKDNLIMLVMPIMMNVNTV